MIQINSSSARNEETFTYDENSNSLSDTNLQFPSISYTPERYFQKQEQCLEQQTESHRITSFVRTEYLNYIEKLLRENYNTWCTVKSPDDLACLNATDVKKCARNMELKAVQSCMMLNLYRKSILRMFTEIRKETEQCVLNPKLKELTIVNVKHSTVDACVQTDFEQLHAIEHNEKLSSLDERVRIFEMRLKEEHYQRKKFKSYLETEKLKQKVEYEKAKRMKLSECIKTQNNIEESKLVELKMNSNTENPNIDQLDKELEKLFGLDSEITNDIDDIFGEGNRSSQILNIQMNNKIENLEPNEEIVQNLDIQQQTLKKELEDVAKNKLKDSTWPCELHIQRLKYQELMLRVSDMGYRHSYKMKQRMLQLFGEDSDDEEIALYSPNIEFNEILLASSRKRIAPIIVNSLMIMMKKGRIANKALFKSVAKRIAEVILQRNLYPSTDDINQFIKNYFSSNLIINSVEDIT